MKLQKMMAVLTLGTLRALSRPLAEPGLRRITHILADLSSFRRKSTARFSSQTTVVNLPALLLLRALLLPTSHGGQTSRPSVQNGGMARNGLKEIGLMSIKNGMLITMASGTIGNIYVWYLITSGFARVALPYT